MMSAKVARKARVSFSTRSEIVLAFSLATITVSLAVSVAATAPVVATPVMSPPADRFDATRLRKRCR